MTYLQNILSVYNQADDVERASGMNWYANANNTAQFIADTHELPLRIVVGVIAALSPTNKWGRNIHDADHMCSTFVSGGYVEDTTPCTYKPMRDKAWSILTDMPEDDIAMCSILNGPKITDFYMCIMGHDTCVIDGHAWCIANDDRRTMQEVPFIGKKLRAELQDAYRVAGNAVGISAYQMQAITWVTWRRIHKIEG